MKILVTNDDGIQAQGIAALQDALAQDHEVVTMAPLSQMSATGHGLSLKRPLRVVPFGQEAYGCSGYPADCIAMGIEYTRRLKNARPDVVVSGINQGVNLGQDVYYSGTVAAAREAAFRSIPSIAVSLALEQREEDNAWDGVVKKGHFYYETAAEVVSRMLSQGIHRHIQKMHLLNVNVPNVPFSGIKGIELTGLGFRHYSEGVQKRTDPKGGDYFWLDAGYRGSFSDTAHSDCQAIENTKVSVTSLNILPISSDKREVWDPLLGAILEG